MFRQTATSDENVSNSKKSFEQLYLKNDSSRQVNTQPKLTSQLIEQHKLLNKNIKERVNLKNTIKKSNLNFF